MPNRGSETFENENMNQGQQRQQNPRDNEQMQNVGDRQVGGDEDIEQEASGFENAEHVDEQEDTEELSTSDVDTDDADIDAGYGSGGNEIDDANELIADTRRADDADIEGGRSADKDKGERRDLERNVEREGEEDRDI